MGSNREKYGVAEGLGETQKLPGRQAMRDTGSEGGETEESLAPKHTEEETARRGQRRKAKGSLSERWRDEHETEIRVAEEVVATSPKRVTVL